MSNLTINGILEPAIKVSMPAKQWKSVMLALLPSVYVGAGRYGLTGVHICEMETQEHGKHLRIASTDGHRLAIARIKEGYEVVNITGKPLNILINYDAVKFFSGLKFDRSITQSLAYISIGFAPEDRNASGHSYNGLITHALGNFTQSINLVNADFPDVERVNPLSDNIDFIADFNANYIGEMGGAIYKAAKCYNIRHNRVSGFYNKDLCAPNKWQANIDTWKLDYIIMPLNPEKARKTQKPKPEDLLKWLEDNYTNEELVMALGEGA